MAPARRWSSITCVSGLLIGLLFLRLIASSTVNNKVPLDSPPPSNGPSGGSVVTILSLGSKSDLSCSSKDLDNNSVLTSPVQEVINQWEISPHLISGPVCSDSSESTIQINLSLDSSEAIDSYLDAMLDKKGAAFLVQSYRMPCGLSTLKIFTTLNGSSFLFACDPNEFQQVQSDYGPLLSIIEMPFLCCSPPSHPNSPPLPPPPLSPSPPPTSLLPTIPSPAPPDLATVKSVQPIDFLPATEPTVTSQPSPPSSFSATFVIVGVAVAVAVAAAVAAVVIVRRRTKSSSQQTSADAGPELSIGSLPEAEAKSEQSLTWIDPWARSGLPALDPDDSSLRGDSFLEKSDGGAQKLPKEEPTRSSE